MVYLVYQVSMTSKLQRNLLLLLFLKLKNQLLEAGVLIGFNLSREFIRLLPPLNIQDNEIKFLKEKIVRIFEF